MNDIFIKRNILAVYFILAFIISWGLAAVVVGPAEIINTRAVGTETKLPMVIIAMVMGPFLAGLFSTWLTNKKTGLKDFWLKLKKLPEESRWYLALFIAPVSLIITDLLLILFSPNFAPAIFFEKNKLSFLGFTLFGALIGGLFEEIGWTGFAIPRMLKKLSVFKTAIGLGLIWGAWHFLVNLWGSANSSLDVPLAVYLGAALFSFLIPYRIFMVWVYKFTQSLLLAILMHCSLITFWLILAPRVGTGIFRVVWFLTWAAVLWLAVLTVGLLKKETLFKRS